MSKKLAVAMAVANQLHHEGRWPPNDLNKSMGPDYHYDENTLALFLTAVQWNLAHGTPPYDFQFDGKFVKANLPTSVGALIGRIDAKTKAI